MEIDKTPPFKVGQKLICLNKDGWISKFEENERIWQSRNDSNTGFKSAVPCYEEEVNCGKIELRKDRWIISFFEYGLDTAFFISDKTGKELFKISDKANLDIYSFKEWKEIQGGIQFFILKQEEERIISVKRIMDGKTFQLYTCYLGCHFNPDTTKKLKRQIIVDVSIDHFFDDRIHVKLNYLFRLRKKAFEETDEDIPLNIFLQKKIQINEIFNKFSAIEYSFAAEFIESNIDMINAKILAAEKQLELS